MNLENLRKPSALDWARWWPAPAKLNLFLHILGKRPDGYHELETVFQILDLNDQIQFHKRDDGEIIRLEGDQNIAPEEDIVVKAALALRAHVLKLNPYQNSCTASQGVGIKYRKRIPVEAGMGGGSSDAATCLLVLNHLWQCGLSNKELARIGVQLGADVPVFVFGKSAYAQGVGEKLQAVELGESWYLIIKPQVSVSTQKIFANSRLTRDTDTLTIHRFLRQYQGSKQALPGHNDCEKLVCENFEEIAQVIEWLDNFGEARLTGTGSAVFIRCRNENTAKAVLDQFSLSCSAQNWQAMIAKGLDKSPLSEIFAEMQLQKAN